MVIFQYSLSNLPYYHHIISLWRTSKHSPLVALFSYYSIAFLKLLGELKCHLTPHLNRSEGNVCFMIRLGPKIVLLFHIQCSTVASEYGAIDSCLMLCNRDAPFVSFFKNVWYGWHHKVHKRTQDTNLFHWAQCHFHLQLWFPHNGAVEVLHDVTILCAIFPFAAVIST